VARKPTDDQEQAPTEQGVISGAVRALLERARYLAVIGVLTPLVLAAATFVWAIVKAFSFVKLLVMGNSADDLALVELFESC